MRNSTKCTLLLNTSNQTYPWMIALSINTPYLIWNQKRYRGHFSKFPSLNIGYTGQLWSGFLFASRTTFNTHEKITDKIMLKRKLIKEDLPEKWRFATYSILTIYICYINIYIVKRKAKNLQYISEFNLSRCKPEFYPSSCIRLWCGSPFCVWGSDSLDAHIYQTEFSVTGEMKENSHREGFLLLCVGFFFLLFHLPAQKIKLVHLKVLQVHA